MRRRLTRGQRGQSMVEFALVMPIAITLLFAIFQGGVLYFQKLQVERAAREGARRISVDRGVDTATATCDARSAARLAATGLLPTDCTHPSGTATTSVSYGNSTTNQGDPVTVTVSYPTAYKVYGIAFWTGTLTSSMQVSIE